MNRERRVFAVLMWMFVATAGFLASCAVCRPVSADGVDALSGVDVGDPLRIRLVDGRVIQDDFILATETRLECRFHEFQLSEVECIERVPGGSGAAFGATVVAGFGLLLLFGALVYSTGGFWR